MIFFSVSWGWVGPQGLLSALQGLGWGKQGVPQQRGLSFLCGWPLRANPASSHPSQGPPLLSGPPLVQENQFFSPVSTYPEARIHVWPASGERPIFILVPSPIHVPSHVHIPVVLVSIRVLQGPNSHSRLLP